MKTKTIKRTIFTAAFISILSLTSFNSQAQFGFAFGPKGGATISKFRGSNLENINARTAWFGGLFMNFQIAPAVAIQPEFLLTERGADVTSNSVRNSVRINYFEVPVLLKLRLPLGNDVILPHILLGPNFAFKTKVDLSSRDTNTGTNLSVNTGDIRKQDVGGLLGAGVDIQTPGNGVFFTLDGRYGMGFSNVNKNDDAIEIKHVGWYFSAGLGFRVGKNKYDNDNDD